MRRLRLITIVAVVAAVGSLAFQRPWEPVAGASSGPADHAAGGGFPICLNGPQFVHSCLAQSMLLRMLYAFGPAEETADVNSSHDLTSAAGRPACWA